MTDLPRTQPTPRPAAIALSLAGVAEITISVILFIMSLYTVSIAFAGAALFIALAANAIRGQAEELARARGEIAVPPGVRFGRWRLVAFWALCAVSLGLIVGSALYGMLGRALAAAAMGIWALTGMAFAFRLRMPLA